MKSTILFCAWGLAWLLLFWAGLPMLAVGQQNPLDEYYTPPSNAPYFKATSGDFSAYYVGDNALALRFYPARLWYTTFYFGIEKTLGQKFSISLDGGWHSTKSGLYINAFGPTDLIEENIFNVSALSTQTYSDLHANGTPLSKTLPTIGFSARFYPQKKESHTVPFLQLQYQFTESRLLMQDYQDQRFAGTNDTATLILHTAMIRYGIQWTYGDKLKFIHEFSMGIGVNMRLSSAYEAVLVSTVPNSSIDDYFLNTLTGENQRRFTPRFQFAYSIGIGY